LKFNDHIRTGVTSINGEQEPFIHKVKVHQRYFENEDFSEAWVSEIFDEEDINVDFEQNDTEDLS